MEEFWSFIILAIGSGLAFTIFTAFAKLLEKLPKSFRWLQEVKVIFGFLELALALKFLSIVEQVCHWGIPDREITLQ